jgi:hypothetical protein
MNHQLAMSGRQIGHLDPRMVPGVLGHGSAQDIH